MALWSHSPADGAFLLRLDPQQRPQVGCVSEVYAFRQLSHRRAMQGFGVYGYEVYLPI
jgi:hypothetical protein